MDDENNLLNEIFSLKEKLIFQMCIRDSVTTALKMGGSNAGVPSIGNNCVLGPGSKILGSVTLGDNVFVGANAVVTHDMPSNSIVAGIPAKVISMNGLQSTELVRQHK